MEENIPRSTIWHTSPRIVLAESETNHGRKGRVPIHGRRLLRHGYNTLCINTAGEILVTKVRGIPIGNFTPSPSRDEFWLYEPTRHRTISQASSPSEKAALLRSLFPSKVPPAFSLNTESKFRLVLITWTSVIPSRPTETIEIQRIKAWYHQDAAQEG